MLPRHFLLVLSREWPRVLGRKGIPLKEATRDCFLGGILSFPAENQQVFSASEAGAKALEASGGFK